MTSTTRVRQTRQRQREAGLVRVEVIVPRSKIDDIREYAVLLRNLDCFQRMAVESRLVKHFKLDQNEDLKWQAPSKAVNGNQ